MKLALTALVALLFNLTAPDAQAQRLDIKLSSGWKFLQHDAELTAPTDDWQDITVPHTWNAREGSQDQPAAALSSPADSKHGRYFRGTCWYARSLDIPAEWKDKRVFIRCEAACLVAKVYLNGRLLGEHDGAFTAFCFELTPHLHFGGANELRVMVDNAYRDDIPPLSGDFNMDGGLYRPVHLLVTDAVCITPLDFASPGVYLTTESLDSAAAKVEARTLISNGGQSASHVQVQVRINTFSGQPVAAQEQEIDVATGQTQAIAPSLTISHPRLWQGRKDPYLYSVTVRVLHDGLVVDEVTQPLGLRTVAISPASGFLLNGQPYPIRGVNRHQDMEGEGWAITQADQERDAQIILDLGATAVRDTHYPQANAWHDLADHNGLLLWDEVSLVNEIRDTPGFTANAELQLRELILQLYNHPCIAFWGLFNELENSPTPPPGRLLTRLKAVINSLDRSRLIVAAADHVHRSYNLIPDAVCFNAYPGWYVGRGDIPADEHYDGKPGQIGPYIHFRTREVGKRIGMSEFGAGGNPDQHTERYPLSLPSTTSESPFHPEEWQTYLHEQDYAQMKNNPDLWGTFIWCMFDFASSGRHEGGTIGINDKGLVTRDRAVRKDAFYLYQANWTDAPMVYIATRRNTRRTQALTTIEVFSNCPEVELLINGKSLGVTRPDSIDVFRWPNVLLQPGANQVQAVGRSRDRNVQDACEWSLITPR